jgi:hypothetical protein
MVRVAQRLSLLGAFLRPAWPHLDLRPISSMSSVPLPCEEIEQIWFEGVVGGPGKPPNMGVFQRWFMVNPEFDSKCQYF